jgi:hypothetical protein
VLQIEPLHSGSASRLVTKRRARADVVSGIGQEQRTLAASGRNLWTQPLDATSGRNLWTQPLDVVQPRKPRASVRLWGEKSADRIAPWVILAMSRNPAPTG